MPKRDCRCRRARGDAESSEDVLQVTADSFLAEHKLSGNLTIAHARGYQSQHFHLARGQKLLGPAAGELDRARLSSRTPGLGRAIRGRLAKLARNGDRILHRQTPCPGPRLD